MRRILLLYFPIAMVLLSCKKENRCDCFKGTGADADKVILPPGFNSIQVNCKATVEVFEGAENKVTVTAGSKLVDLIDASVQDSVLVVSDRNKCAWSRSFKNEVKIRIEVLHIDMITQFGNGVISTDTLHSPEFTLDIKNSGDVHLLLHANTSHCNIHVSPGDLYVSGKTGVSYIYNSGYGYIDASGLQSDITFLGNHSTGICHVQARDRLEVDITGEGDVYYAGNPPELKSNITGTGKLIRE